MAVNASIGRAVFFDKDGTLIEDVPYNVDPVRLRLMPGAIEGLRALQAAGFRLIVVTNQSGVARRLFTEPELAVAHAALDELLLAAGVTLDGFYYCPHLPAPELFAWENPCACRKPSPGLLEAAAADRSLGLTRSWLIGDIADDIEAGRRAGCRTVLVAGCPDDDTTAHFVARDLAEAAAIIIRESRSDVAATTVKAGDCA